MLFGRFIKKVMENGVKEAVIADDLIGFASELENQKLKVTVFKDVRSATFFACGKSEETDLPVLLVIKLDYISSCYTGLIESWFQQRKVIVLAIGEEIVNKDYDYLLNCSACIWKIQNEKDIDSFFEVQKLEDYMPYVFIMEKNTGTVSQKEHSISIANNLLTFDKVFLFESIKLNTNYKNVVYIHENEKYCVFSKFIGYVVARNKPCLLVVPSSLIGYDINIFNNRYTNSNVKIVIVRDAKEKIMTEWITSNGFCLFDKKEETEFFKSNKQSILLY